MWWSVTNKKHHLCGIEIPPAQLLGIRKSCVHRVGKVATASRVSKRLSGIVKTYLARIMSPSSLFCDFFDQRVRIARGVD